MPTSDEDLRKQQDTVQKLRDQVAAARATAETKAREQDNDVAAAQLQAEEIRLKTELAQLKEAGKATTVKAGAAGPIEAAKAQVSLAEAQAKMVEDLRAADAKARENKEAADAEVAQVVANQATTAGAPDAERSN